MHSYVCLKKNNILFYHFFFLFLVDVLNHVFIVSWIHQKEQVFYRNCDCTSMIDFSTAWFHRNLACVPFGCQLFKFFWDCFQLEQSFFGKVVCIIVLIIYFYYLLYRNTSWNLLINTCLLHESIIVYAVIPSRVLMF